MPTLPAHGPEVETRLRHWGERLRAAERAQGSAWEERWIGALFDRLASRPRLRAQALRFIDVLPALESDAEVADHFREYFAEESLPLPGLARWGARLAGAAGDTVVAAAIRRSVGRIGAQFIAGADAPACIEALRVLRAAGRRVSVDLLGEAVLSEDEADAYVERCNALVRDLAGAQPQWRGDAALDRMHGRAVPPLNLSIKLSSLHSQAQPRDLEGSVARIAERLRPLLRAVRAAGASLCFDMEHYDLKPVILATFRGVMDEPEFRDWPDAGIALQAYLPETEDDLVALASWARKRGTPVGVRLVRGAYWDHETAIARQQGWPLPVWSGKDATDACFERCATFLFASHPHLEPALATHNVRSVALAAALAEAHGRGPGDFEIQMLYGMAAALQRAAVDAGLGLRTYVPVGELLPGMAYLVRRLLENSASQSALRIGPRAEDDATALRRPSPEPVDEADAGSPDGFAHAPLQRFTGAEGRARFGRALAEAARAPARDFGLWIGGRWRETGRWIESFDPARPGERIGRVAAAGEAEADEAVAGATAAAGAWAATPVAERAGWLRGIADALEQRRDAFAAAVLREAGKDWSEADADVAEAIDFLRYYAAEAERLWPPRALDAPGEENRYGYRPRGVALVLPPWNFPLAILVGMTAAALAAGNCAIVKPASLTPVVAARFVELIDELGFPPGVLQFLPGAGESVGERLARHPGVHAVAFTGSRDVGLRLLRLAAEIAPAQRHIKRVIAEMGGKNAIIVDADADPDDAVAGIVASAFGYQGQKCSACSRVIVVGSGRARFVARLVAAARSLRIGPPDDPGNAIGPIISAAAKGRILRAIEDGGRHARLVLEPSRQDDGPYLGPAIFDDVPPDCALAQEEIFGPVLAVLHADDFDAALEIANGTGYALTGGVYSRHPAHLRRAMERFEVGNLYLNRGITGARVGRQPFGGFRLSGVGAKAGGPDYLMQFVEARTVTENTLRRGFAPDPGVNSDPV